MSPSMKRKRAACSGVTQCREFLEVAAMPGGEIVEADDLLIEREQRLDEVRADETGGARHQPAPRRGPQLPAQRLVAARHQRLQQVRSGRDAAISSRGTAPLTSTRTPFSRIRARRPATSSR